MVDRSKTGVLGLDTIIGGGFPAGSIILVSGGTGTGKSIFCVQFLYKGVTEFKEPGIFIALEERPKDIRRFIRNFGWDLKKLEEQNKLAIIDASAARLGIPSDEKYIITKPSDVDSLITTIDNIVQKINAKRIVVDSLPALMLQYDTPIALRRELLRLGALLEDTGCTTLMTTEADGQRISKFGVEEFICHGIINFSLSEMGAELKRNLIVLKMRGIKHSTRRYPFEITPEGIAIFPGEEAYQA